MASFTIEELDLFAHTLALDIVLICLFAFARCKAKRCDVRLDLFGYRLWKIPDCCNHFAMACMTIQLTKQSHLKPNQANEAKRRLIERMKAKRKQSTRKHMLSTLKSHTSIKTSS
jgi:hypothetical protein